MTAARLVPIRNCVHRLCSCVLPSTSYCNGSRYCSTDSTKEIDEIETPRKKPEEVPDPPTGMCCGTGCPNCVWVQYADKLVELYKDKGVEQAMKEIDKSLDDDALKTFIKLDIKLRYGSKKLG